MTSFVATLLVSPAFYLAALAVAIWAFRRWNGLKWTLIAVFCIAAAVFTSRPAYVATVKWWCKGYTGSIERGKHYHYGIVLGGFGNWDAANHRIVLNNEAARLTEAVQLYQKGKIRKMVIAADPSFMMYGGPARHCSPGEMRTYVMRMGVKSRDVILEKFSTTTRENATRLNARMGDSLRKERPLLITSATHMRRALLSFRQAGLDADPYIVNYPETAVNRPHWWLPTFSMMRDWSVLLHEMVGYVAYRAKVYAKSRG